VLPQPGVANRRGTHVNTAATLPEVERRPDHNDFPIRWLHTHRYKANVPRVTDPEERFSEEPLRVLLVDDDASFLDSLRPLIDHQPELTVVGAAANGLDAIELADDLLPDAVVIDLHMPLVDGVTAVARLRKDHPNLCLITVTADPDSELHRAVTEAGADAVLLKGDLIDALVERLSAVRPAVRT
jgi:CheY-like chemotaxis protein